MEGDRKKGLMTFTWDDLDRELDLWAAGGRPASLWWRDDDAVAPTPELETLLRLSGAIPLSLAVIPGEAQSDLAGRLADESSVTILQHGFRHTNHARKGEKKIELGGSRSDSRIEDDLRQGQARLGDLFTGRTVDVLVPPWNRIAPDIVSRLPALGLTALSTFGQRTLRGIRCVNTHVDVIDWRGGRGFMGVGRSLGQLVGHLAQRRDETIDPRRATGLLTHHRVHDRETWAFLQDLIQAVERHPGACWVDVGAA
jgi:hypothetical protein